VSPVVVAAVHGMEDDERSWEPLIARLRARLDGVAWQPVALRLPWCSGNDYRWRAEGTPGEWLARKLRALPAPPDVLIGHSFGANAILELLAANAIAPSRAVLLAPFYRPLSLVDNEDLRNRSSIGFTRIIGAGLRAKLGARADQLDPDLVASMAEGLCERLVPIAFPILYDAFVGSGLLDLTSVTVPTLVLAGTDDAALAGERAVALAAAMPAAAVRPQPGYTHFCHIEQADVVAAEVAAFVPEFLPRSTPGSIRRLEVR
jgi:pimeloyl-ACP methyl ester carboxylesterase